MFRRFRPWRFLLRLVIVLILTGLLLEVLGRVFYARLPAAFRTVLGNVHVTPFTNQRLASTVSDPANIWINDDPRYETVTLPGIQERSVQGSESVTFTVSTYSWYGDRVGFRSPLPADLNLRAVALGDSFTFCWTVQSDCWVNRLSALTQVEVLNMGQPGTGSVAHANLYEDFVAKRRVQQPKLVLWQWYGNDYAEDFNLAVLNGTNQTVPLATYPVDAWLADNSIIYATISMYARARLFASTNAIKTATRDFTFAPEYFKLAFDMTRASNLEGERSTRDVLLRTRQQVEANGGVFVVIVIPSKEEVYEALTEPLMGKTVLENWASTRTRLLDFCAAEKLRCFDPLTGFQAQTQQIYFRDDPHLNAEGNRVLAELLAKYLTEQGLLK